MHLNDIEAFPSTMTSDIFSPGDLLLSVRNINTVMVVDPKTWTVKWKSTGPVLRQHDADFMPGDRISVLDNRNFDSAPEAGAPASRIVEFDVKTGAVRTVVSGDGPVPFFTRTKGVHQRLENGNILVTSTHDGMVVEYAPDGTPVWRFEHRVAPDKNRIIYHARVLPPEMDEAFFKARAGVCGAASGARSGA
jgi:outer membrane protein assembly factor BamB